MDKRGVTSEYVVMLDTVAQAPLPPSPTPTAKIAVSYHGINQVVTVQTTVDAPAFLRLGMGVTTLATIVSDVCAVFGTCSRDCVEVRRLLRVKGTRRRLASLRVPVVIHPTGVSILCSCMKLSSWTAGRSSSRWCLCRSC